MDTKKRIAAEIRDYIARERLSREQFAFKTKLGKSTVDKLLVGLFSERTLSVVEAHTPLRLRPMLEGSAPEPQPPLAHPDKPSIAVLPFAIFSSEPEHDFLADGITEDVLTALARLRWLFVIARHSSFTYKGRAVDVREVARELGVRYVLEGSVRVVGERIRVNAQLVDARGGSHLWADRYDREIGDVFAVQDEIAERVVAAVEPQIYAEEGFRAASRPPESIDAWALVVRAMGLVGRMDRSQSAQARTLLERAVAMEPGYARARALLAWTACSAAMCLWPPDPEESLRQASAHAQEALALDPGEPWARMVYGYTLSCAAQHDRAVAELRTALTLHPSFALGRSMLGWALLRAGRFEDAVTETARALRMSPLDNFSGFYSSLHGLALLGAYRFEEALPHLRAAVAAFADFEGHYNTLISCCGHLGRLDEAREFLAIRNQMDPPLRLSVARRLLARYAHAETFVAGLAKAGVPE